MIVKRRDTTLRYPRAIRHDKMQIVLEWLLEFRFSSIEILASRIGSNSINSNRFFKKLIDDGIIQVFSNAHTMNHRFVMLTTISQSYLDSWGVDAQDAVTSQKNYHRYSSILHDLEIQKYALNKVDYFKEIVWDRNIEIGENFERPDLLALTATGWRAFEYERWRKDKKRVYRSFCNHANAILNQKYDAIYYLFDNESDIKVYSDLFIQAKWPVYIKSATSGKNDRKPMDFLPDEHLGLRQKFVFTLIKKC